MVLSRTHRGFTLVELLVAAVIAAIVAGSAVASVSQMLRLKAKSAARQQAFERADIAAERMCLDMCNIVRHHNLQFARVTVTDGGSGTQANDGLMLLTRSVRPVRNEMDAAEGGEYEVQYRVQAAGATDPRPALWRRCDPAHDLYQDAGGVAAPVVRGVKSLSIQAYDGNEWFEAWDSDSDGYPHAIRIEITTESDDGLASAMCRRTVAMDRTPLPPVPAEETDSGGSTTPTTPSSTGTTGGGS